MTKCIYLAWQDQVTRGWHVIGQLLRINERFEFRYTEGVKKVSNFSLLPSMPNHEEVYSSSELFSLFKNRLMPKSRPDYPDYIRWMGLTKEESEDELVTLAISGGEKETDFFRILPIPEKNNDNEYSVKFFANGISHMSIFAQELVNKLKKNDTLYLSHDFQNSADKLAITLRTEEPPTIIGYVPAYFTKIIHKLREGNEFNIPKVIVAQVNIGAPIQLRLLCKLSSNNLNKSWDKYEDEFKPLAP